MTKIKTTLIGSVLVIGIGFYAWKTDYAIEERFDKMQSQGWVLVNSKKDWEPLKPWTWIKQPIQQATFVEEPVNGKLPNGYFFVGSYIYNAADNSSTNQITIIDHKRKRYTSFKNADELKRITLVSLEKRSWSQIHENSTEWDFMVYMESKAKQLELNNEKLRELPILAN